MLNTLPAFYWRPPPQSSFVWKNTKRIDAGPISFESALAFCDKNRIPMVAVTLHGPPVVRDVTQRNAKPYETLAKAILRDVDARK